MADFRLLTFLVLLAINFSCLPAERIWTIGIGGDWGAYEYMDENGFLQGYLVDLMNLVCEEAGINCQFTQDNSCWQSNPGSHASPGKGLISHRYDACIGYQPTFERVHSFSLSQPFFAEDHAYFYTLKQTDLDVHNLSEKKIGFFWGAPYDESCIARQETITNNILGPDQAIYEGNVQQLLYAALSGKIDAVFGGGDFIPADSSIWTLAKRIDVPFDCTLGGYSLMARKDSPIIALWNVGFTKLRNTNRFIKFCEEAAIKHRMIPLVGDWSIRCMQLAAGVASLYFCHAIYNRNIADIPPYQLGPIAISSDSESESEILERSLGTVLDRTKQIVITGFKKAASLFITDEETLVQGLSTYVDSIYDHPKVQKRFPIKPEILRPSDVVLAHSWAGKRVCIGSGQMGAVYLGFNKIAGKKVAIKFATDRRCDINFMIHEASLMTHLNDTGATPFCHGLMPVRSGTNHPMAALVMDLVGGEINNKPLDIASFIQENKGKLNSEEYRSLFIDITEKIGRIHDKGVVINDIKEENILVYKKSTSGIGTSIIDFGSSRYGDYTFCLNRQLNKEVYYSEYSHMAPEIFERHRVTPVSDVYSLSGIFCDMGKLLGYGDLMYVGIKCTRVDPDTRPNIEKVKKLLSEMDLESEEDISL